MPATNHDTWAGPFGSGTWQTKLPISNRKVAMNQIGCDFGISAHTSSSWGSRP